MIRRYLHLLYTACGYAAAGFLAMIAVLTLAQVVARQLGIPLESIELAGFCLAASTFLGLAHTFVNGGHVRVAMLSNALPKAGRRWLEAWCCLVGLGASGYAAWHMAGFTWETYIYGDLSPGLAAMPLWIPQSGVAAGLAVLAVGFAEQLAVVLTGGTPDYVLHGGSGHE
ncbi:TRAP transporter small permease [Mangrovicoccus sp. HB161399]|uniref:TRAP transporter small permease n=1 Tax=Mangrovicoccus sp. HB161399 TaxID=2720392 RepID=UPI0015549DE5|nr:TRAP transporter small permease [Mangrovicoccus sp. HB161399]